MNTDSRRVRLLALKSPDRSGVSRGKQMVEEALGRATFPGDGLPGRLVIRFLELDLLPASGQGIDVRVSEALARAWSSAVSFSSPAAREATAVRVPAEIDVWVELGRRAVAAKPFELSGWFWPALVPNLPDAADRSQALRLAVDVLLQGFDGVPALASLLAQLVEDGTAPRLLETLSLAHGSALLREARLTAPRTAAPAGAADPSERPQPHVDAAPSESQPIHRDARWAFVLQEFVPHWGPDDPRSAWLCFAAIWAAHPSRTATRSIHERVHRLAREAAARRPAATVGTPTTTADSSRPSRPASASPPENPRAAQSREAPAHEARTASAQFCAIAAPTECAGLFFALPILGYLKIDEFLESEVELADMAFVCRVLQRLADRSEIPDTDPIRLALAAVGSDVEGSPAHPRLERLLDDWEYAIAAWLAAHTDLECRALVRRPGKVAFTRTHLDVFFALNDADVRVRKLGLDINPGYVSHLGRIVTFHYS